MKPGVVALTIGVLGALAALSLVPFPQPDMPGPLEQLPHATAYAVATFALLTMVDRNTAPRPSTVASVAFSMVMGGIALELAQSVLERDVEIADVLANCIGVAAAVVVSRFVRRSRGAGGAGGRRATTDATR
jgi:VanZ family protein